MPSPERSHDRDRHSRSSRRDRDDGHRHRRSHRHSHRSRSRDRDRDRDRKKRSHNDDHHSSRRRHKRSHRTKDKDSTEDAPAIPKPAAAEEEDDNGEWVESAAPAPRDPTIKRDSWMVEPSATDIDYTQRGARKASPKHVAQPDYRPVIHKNELNEQLRAGKSLDEYAAVDPAQEEAGYEFGDNGSKWRMSKLKRIYEHANETGESVDEVAEKRYGSLKLWDDAREEETELERREMYGVDRADAKTRPTGDLYRARVADMKEKERRRGIMEARVQGRTMETAPTVAETKALDPTALNKMRAALMKAQLRGDHRVGEMEKEYNKALAASQMASKKEPDVVVLTAMDNRQLAGLDGRIGKQVVEGKRGRLLENDDMSIADMVKEEKRTKGQGEGKVLAERISRDAKFDDNLDYLDENASRLAQRIQKNEISIKNTAISDFKKLSHILNACPLCEHEYRGPIAPVVSLATRTYLTLPTDPDLSATPACPIGGAMIIPIQHRTNMLELDDDEWEEVRNFMKSLIRLYASLSPPHSVIFYENASSPARHRHAAITAVPLPPELTDTAGAYFKEAILSADSEWSQHKPIMDTRGMGKMGFRRTLVKEMPYFHVWLEIDGGLGHVVEDERRWPKGDLFAREIIGGMLDVEATIIKKQGGWRRGEGKEKIQRFKEKWDEYDWTKVLYNA